MLKKIFPNLLPSPSQQYLFIICPPHGGSTLMHEFISTSPHVSINNNKNTREGQGIPEARKLMFLKDRWKRETRIPWKEVKKVWEKHWDLDQKILLDKSTMNVPHVFSIQKVFRPAYFICMVRNPYAYCEGLMRRMGYDEKKAASFSMYCLRLQKENLAGSRNSLLVRYEDFTDNPSYVSNKIINFLPSLASLQHEGLFHAHNFKNQALPIHNMNAEKIANLSKEQLAYFTDKFKKHAKLMAYFGYDFINPS